MKRFRNRDFLLILSVVLGLVNENGAHGTKSIVIPALAMVMTLSIMGISGSVFRFMIVYIVWLNLKETFKSRAI
jgi:hypothetical protein